MDFLNVFARLDFKKRFCRYLLNHYLGQFLEQKFSLDQLEVNVYEGRGTVSDVILDCQALNQLAEEQSIPVEFIEARAGSISVAVPWAGILKESSEVDVSDLIVTVQPKLRTEHGNSMLNSMFTSMASSMHLAEDFLKTVEKDNEYYYNDDSSAMPGLESCANAIEAVLSRVKINFKDTIIRVLRVHRNNAVIGLGLELHIQSWKYSDELGTDLKDERKFHETSHAHKKFSMQGLKIYTDIFKTPVQSSYDPFQTEPENLILLGSISGAAEIRLRLKLNESISGPQVTVECSFGSLVALLSPFQVHLLNLILEDFLDPPSTADAFGYRSHLKEKPMDSFDFKRIQQELDETNRKEMIGIPGINQQGWSSGFEHDDEDQFFAFKPKQTMLNSISSNLMEASVMSTASSMNQSMTDSIATSFGLKSEVSDSPSKYRPYNMSGPAPPVTNGDAVKFSVSVASAAIVILHEDIVNVSLSVAAEPAKVEEMKQLAKEFIASAGILNAGGYKHVQETKAALQKSCLNCSYLSIIATPIKVEGFCGVEDGTPLNHGHVSCAFLEILETLPAEKVFNGIGNSSCTTQLLTFPQSGMFSGKECARLDFRHKAYRARTSVSKVTLRIHLQDCKSEFDLSIIDRLSQLRHPQHALLVGCAKLNEDSSSTSRSVILLKITSSDLSVDFRFPIPDLRGPEHPDKIPFNIRNVRDDSIIFCLKDVSFATSIDSDSDIFECDTQCQQAELFYKSSPGDTPILFATASCDDITAPKDGPSLAGYDRPRVVVTIYPERRIEIVNDGHKSEEDESLAKFISMDMCKRKPSPFSSRRVLHECLGSNTGGKNNTGDFGESVIPGDANEMKRFIDEAVSNVMYKVECHLRFVEVNFPSKQFFEAIYNRLTMDLLLWEPSAPKSSVESVDHFRGCHGPQQFSMCKSGIRADSDSEGEADNEELLSLGPAPFLQNFRNKPDSNKKVLPDGQSEVTINLNIASGACSFFTPFEDSSGNIIPDMKGQISIEINNGNLFVVSGYKGNTNLGFLCVRSEKAAFYHNDHAISAELCPFTDSSMKKIIYPSDDGVRAARMTSESDAEDKDMLSVAVKIDKDTTKNLKTFKVAIGIKGGTIDYLLTLPNRSWFTQIVDFFDVFDVPIAGYTAATVMTELHLHLRNCAASYTPIHLPMRSILTLQNFSVSVNIAAQTNMKVITFIAEDAALLLSNKKSSSDLQHDYVCVMDMDLFDLVVRICLSRPGTNANIPQLEMKASNNVLHMRTCSDSMKMLIELITYLVNEGDLPPSSRERDLLNDNVPGNTDINFSSASADCDDFFSSGMSAKRQSTSFTGTADQSSSSQLHDMVAEAMKENVNGAMKEVRRQDRKNSVSSLTENDPLGNQKIFRHQTLELHFDSTMERQSEDCKFYLEEEDESAVSTPAPPVFPPEPIMENCNGLPVSLQLSDEDEEEFCILENDPGVGFMPRNGEPEVRVLSEKPIELIENHFTVPLGKVDVLQAPKHYPKPVLKFTIQEMSLVWHMYGGEDFGTNLSHRAGSSTRLSRTSFGESSETLYSESNRTEYDYYESSDVDMAVDALNPGVVFSKTKAFESAWEAYESPKNKRRNSSGGNRSWRANGGKGRKHDVQVEFMLSKVRFQHEVYPAQTEQASRQVLVINNVEIRDKLKSSWYNKMLYLYISNAMPKQSCANMVVIKAAHLRPDPKLSSIEECCLKISLLPIRLNVDQDTVLFLYQFFSDLAAGRGDSEDDDSASTSSAKPPSHTPSVESLPVMTINTKEEDNLPEQPLEEDTSNLLIFTDEPVPAANPPQDDNVSIASKDSFKQSGPIYFREVIFSPDVPIKLDYRGKNVYDMTNGPIAGILMALGQLDSAEIKLVRLNNNRGLLGGSKLVTYLVTEWVNDIRKNQVPGVLGGVDLVIPMHSFVQLYQGVKSLFYLPVEQYQKDGRLAKGLQRGVNAFSTSAAMAVLKLTNRMVQAFQGAAELTYDLVSPGPSVQQQRRQSSTKRKRYSQPSDIREGVANAYNVVKEGLGDTAHTIVRVASKENEQKGVSGAVGGVLRQIPPTIVKPMILVAEATSNVLEGFRCQLEPDFKKEAEEKWKE